MFVFGPLVSQRLGRCLGIDNTSSRHCSYDCIYSPLGRTDRSEIERRPLFSSYDVLAMAKRRANEAREHEESFDWITFYSAGEPTLDIALGETANRLRTIGVKLAICSNASLLWREDVRHDLMAFDRVTLTCDAADRDTWLRIDRPHDHLTLKRVLNGMLEFGENYEGELCTETKLIRGLNDGKDPLGEIAAFLGDLMPAVAWLSTPQEPPVEDGVHSPDEKTVDEALRILSSRTSKVERLSSDIDDLAFCGDLRDELLCLTAVLPLKHKSIESLLKKAGANWSLVEEMIAGGLLREIPYEEQLYYVRETGSERSL